MIIVKVELWSAITHKVTPLACMALSNDGSGSQDRGNYDVRIFRKGSATEVQRTARVERYPRQSYVIWELIRRALNAAYKKPDPTDAS